MTAFKKLEGRMEGKINGSFIAQSFLGGTGTESPKWVEAILFSV